MGESTTSGLESPIMTPSASESRMGIKSPYHLHHLQQGNNSKKNVMSRHHDSSDSMLISGHTSLVQRIGEESKSLVELQRRRAMSSMQNAKVKSLYFLFCIGNVLF